MVEIQEAKKLQWIKGDKIGTVEIVKDEDSTWTNFKSGRRISTPLLAEFMTEVTNGRVLIDETNNSSVHIKPKAQPVQVSYSNEDVIMPIFKKMEKTDKHKITVSIEIDIPNVNMYKILEDSFGTDAIESTFKSYVNNQIDQEILKSSVNDAIENLINSFDSRMNNSSNI